MFAVLRFLVALFAIALIVGGLALSISPIPGGIIIVIMGLLLLAWGAPAAARFLRKRIRAVDRLMHWLERRLPRPLAKPLRESDWEHDDEPDDEAAEDEAAEDEKARRARPRPRKRR